MTTQPPVELICSEYWLSWLEEHNLSIALSTYQTNRIFFIGKKPDGTLSGFERFFDRAMGLYQQENSLYLATRYQIWRFDNMLTSGQLHQKSYDALYVPTIGYTTADLNTHDLVLDNNGDLIFVNTKYSCLAKLKPGFSFEPIWQPSFISGLTPEDRCHLNGLAQVGGKPKYVTACSRSDVAAAWRGRRQNGGVVIEIESKEIITTGLSMPHSPRYYQGKLWVLNSGSGELGYIESDKFQPVTFCPGFVRGLAFWQNFAIVGMSKPRDRSFNGLALDETLAKKDATAKCGVMVIDLNNGQVAHWLEFEGVVTELFDVVVLPGVKQPMALGFKTDEIQRLVNFPGNLTLPVVKKDDANVQATVGAGLETISETNNNLNIKTHPNPVSETNNNLNIKTHPNPDANEDNLNIKTHPNQVIAEYEKIIAAAPDNIPAYNELGKLYTAEKQYQKAKTCFEKIIQIKPESAPAYTNLGAVFQQMGDIQGAIQAYETAIQLKPNFPLPYLNLGRLFISQKQFPQAGQCYQKALQLQPNNPEVYLELGNLLKGQERIEEAIKAYQTAMKLQPNYIPACLNLGAAWQMRGASQLAKQCYQRVLQAQPDNDFALGNLGIILTEEGDFLGAAKLYQQVIKINPNNTTTFYHFCDLLRQMCHWENHNELERELISRTEKHLRENNSDQLLPLTLNYFNIEPALHKAVASHYAARVEEKMAGMQGKTTPMAKKGNKNKLRLGYVSPDFRNHAVGVLIKDIFQHHNRQKFEVYCYNLTTEDELTATIKANCDQYTDISLMSSVDAAAKINQDEIDILIDLAGYTTYCRPEIFALQPAPIQCSYLGFPGTMGAKFIQYILADKTLIPPELTQYYTEQVIYLPHAFVGSSMEVSQKPITRAEFNLPENAFVFCSFNRPAKISPQVFQVWMEILQAVPNSVLWLYADDSLITQENLQRETVGAGLATNHDTNHNLNIKTRPNPDANIKTRLIFASKLPHPEYLARYQLADLLLDTFNYNAGATAVGALAMGLPVLTLQGKTYASSMGASICHAAGLEEMVCQTGAEYREKAINFGNHPETLPKLRPNLPLFDLPQFVANLETGYEQMWQQQQKKTNQITYQQINNLTWAKTLQFNALTYPSIHKHWRAKTQRGNLLGILALKENETIGLVLAETYDNQNKQITEVLSFFVKPEYRNQGIGINLLQHLQKSLATEIKIAYKVTDITTTALEPILRRLGWEKPKTTFLLAKTTTEKIAQAPWLDQYPLPEKFTIFPWVEITPTELEELKQLNYPPSLSPLTQDSRLEPLNSLGLRYDGKVIGWCLTHRVDQQTIRYSTMYVEPPFQKMGRGIALIAAALKLQINSNIPYYKYAVAADNQPMLRFTQKHLAPYCSSMTESRQSVWSFQPRGHPSESYIYFKQ
ncbi:MAG: TIGR03032 family protein [Gomphosphaeria aponina SAG 52.96 = DSM 107014]|uniref:protein O-GlcNAc transferase n=1 Tax=Gomphosphaeria aponina SAG 52.96 = DSM 107014 TaxID=1521640 RepID=A0A941GX35_9CHRO|nr:TIGR03032 family protein [Gomphosphaeria aponina SAG 52.96 = DSM 107014]